MKLISLLLIIILSGCHLKNPTANIHAKNDANEVLLLGTFHYNNPGADAVKSEVFDVMTDDGQKQLEQLAKKIVKYNPSKIFVEWNLSEQQELDKLYQKYLNGTYYNDKNLDSYYLKSETFQLAFRIAKKLGHKKVYAVDNNKVELDFPAVMSAIQEAKQEQLQKEFDDTIQRLGQETSKRMATMSLEELYLYGNQTAEVISNIELYTQLTIKAGDLQNHAAADMVSNWYKRNLHIWSNIQKQVTQDDKRIMVLFGGGHTAILDQIIAYNSHWKKADLRKVLNGRYIDIDF